MWPVDDLIGGAYPEFMRIGPRRGILVYVEGGTHQEYMNLPSIDPVYRSFAQCVDLESVPLFILLVDLRRLCSTISAKGQSCNTKRSFHDEEISSSMLHFDTLVPTNQRHTTYGCVICLPNVWRFRLSNVGMPWLREGWMIEIDLQLMQFFKPD